MVYINIPVRVEQFNVPAHPKHIHVLLHESKFISYSRKNQGHFFITVSALRTTPWTDRQTDGQTDIRAKTEISHVPIMCID